MKIGFTGTQTLNLPTPQKLAFITVLERWKDAEEFHHGDCISADEFAHYEARKLGIPIIIHPPSNDSKRAFCNGLGVIRIEPTKPYLNRNHDIVDLTDMLIAMPEKHYEELRSGTWSTVRYARKRKKPIYLIWPNGDVTIEQSDESQSLSKPQES